MFIFVMMIFFFKQKTAYEMRISDWSSDVCSSDLSQPIRKTSSHEKKCGSGLSDPHCLRLVKPLNPPIRRNPPRKTDRVPKEQGQIGRASCRERVCQYV